MENVKKTSRKIALALLLASPLTAILPVQSQAKSAFMQECSAKWTAAKADGSAGTMKWTDFMKTQCGSADQAAVAPANAPSVTTPVKPAAQVVAAPAVTSAAKTPAIKMQTDSTATASTSNGSFMQNCSAQWKSMKDAGTIPAGLKWAQFVKQSCAVDGSAAAAVPAPATPAKATPVVAAKAAAKPAVAAPGDTTASADPAAIDPSSPAFDSTVVKTVDKNGKPFTPAQIALHQRMKECGLEWRNDKAAGTLPAGEKWPQYWSACNARLKS